MKAELVKREDRYDLYNKSDGSKIASTAPNPFGMLSLKNCKVIERGYDLDELAKDRFGNSSHHTNNRCSYKEGFQKSLEILGDKKFSEEDMRKAMDRVFDWCEDDKDEDCSSMTELRNKHIQSLQPAEWEVIVEMEGFVDEEGIYCGERPKLDADNYLILKRK